MVAFKVTSPSRNSIGSGPPAVALPPPSRSASRAGGVNAARRRQMRESRIGGCRIGRYRSGRLGFITRSLGAKKRAPDRTFGIGCRPGGIAARTFVVQRRGGDRRSPRRPAPKRETREEAMTRVSQVILATSLVVGLAAALAAPMRASAEDAKAIPQFQVDALWPKPLPNNWILGQVAGITVDRLDRIWIVQRPSSLTQRERAAEQNPPPSRCCAAAPPVLVFDQSGNLVRTWGGPGPGYQWPETEHGIFIDDNDFVWFAGSGKPDGQILKFTMDGKFVMQIGKSGNGNDSNSTERLGSPADIAVDTATHEVYAA